jgi:hypothetical protein
MCLVQQKTLCGLQRGDARTSYRNQRSTLAYGDTTLCGSTGTTEADVGCSVKIANHLD